jgi:hypothetical protein
MEGAMQGNGGNQSGARLKTYLFLFLMLGIFALPWGCGQGEMTFPTEYQAVFLDTGQVFFGKLEQSGSPYPLLRDVFYIRRQVNQEKKEAKNLLIKQGSELHEPEFMRINARHIVIIEPVSPQSRVARLIREYRSPQPAQPLEGTPPPAAIPKAKEKAPAGK